MYRHILIPTDGSPLSDKAVAAGLQLAAHLKARVTVVTVTEPFHMLSLAPSQAEYTEAEYRHHTEQVARICQRSRQSCRHSSAAAVIHPALRMASTVVARRR